MKTVSKLTNWLVTLLVALAFVISFNSCVEEVVPYLIVEQDEIEVNTTAELYSVDVKSNMTWSVSSEQSWIQVFNSKGDSDGKFGFKVDPNFGIEQRSAVITVSSADGSVQLPVLVKQVAAKPELSLTEDKLFFGKNPDSHRIGVQSNHEWKVTSSADWCKVAVEKSESNEEIVITVTENNTSAAKEAIVSVFSAEGVGEPVKQTIEVTQMAEEHYFCIPVEDYQVNNTMSELYIVYDTSDENVEIRPASSVDWITFDRNAVHAMAVDPISRKEFYVNVAANTTGQDRKGTVTVVALFNGTDPVTASVEIVQSSSQNEIAFSVENVNLNPQGENLEIPFTATHKPEVSVSSSWCPASVKSFSDGRGVILVNPGPNYTGHLRETILTAVVQNDLGGAVIQSLKLTQDVSEYRFNLSDEECHLQYQSTEKYITLQSLGDWIIEEDSIPTWLEVSQTEGQGDASVCFSVLTNPFRRAREANIIFKNLISNNHLVLKVSQDTNPYGIENFKYLGKGFDGTGIYAHDAYVRAPVLDCDKLYLKNRIADVINPNQTNELTISGSSVESYSYSYSSYASVSTKSRLFHSSVTTNFSERSAGSSSHSFATFRHMTKKQILKVNQNETAETLQDCLSDEFKEDIQRLAPPDLIVKYGTHVIMGFSLGGVLEYSMSAKSSAFNNQSGMEMAVKAGFELFSIGVETSAGYEQYQHAATEDNEFEQRLLCRGGDSQYGTTVKGSAGQYNNWINSLDDSSKWVMIDYEGNKMIPIWDFITDPLKKRAVQEAAESYIKTGKLPEEGAEKVVFSLDHIYFMHRPWYEQGYVGANVGFEIVISSGQNFETSPYREYSNKFGEVPIQSMEYKPAPVEFWMVPASSTKVKVEISSVNIKTSGKTANLDPIVIEFVYDPDKNALVSANGDEWSFKKGKCFDFRTGDHIIGCTVSIRMD